jgi:enediyne biosynthesis protein E4
MASSDHGSAPSALEDEERGDARIGVAFRWSLLVFLVLGLVGAGTWFWFTRRPPALTAATTPLSLPQVRPAPPLELPRIVFSDVTQESGIRFVHENGAAGEKLLPETMGGGCAFLDFDNDGDQDIVFVNSQKWSWDKRPSQKSRTHALYRNDGTGHFEDVTAGSGLDIAMYGMGVAAGDYDNDGNVDLFISAVGSNKLFRNVGGKFVDITAKAGVAGSPEQWSTSCGWFDFDNDGYLDLFVCNYVKWTRQIDLGLDFQLTGVGRAYGRPQEFVGQCPYLYRNNRDGTFTDISASAGIQVRNPATDLPLAKSLGVAFADFNGDGRLDVFVANDMVQNLLYQNQSGHRFQEIGASAGVAFDMSGNARGAMGVDVAWFRNNESLGIAVGNFANEMTALYVANDNNLLFTDEAVSDGLGPATRLELKFGLFFFDCDLDGYLDILTANGHLEDEINKVQESQHYEQPPALLWNCHSSRATEFVSLPSENVGPAFKRPMVGRGAAYADIDGDGDLDVLLTAVGRAPRLLRNDQKTGHHWLRMKLVGSRSNRDAIGATVEVHAGGTIFKRQVSPTRSYLSQTELPVTFGLGSIGTVDRATIHWPSGAVTHMKNLAIDRMHVIREDR